METILVQLALIAFLLVLAWLVTRNVWIKIPNQDRRNVDFYHMYNKMNRPSTEFEDRTETLFDRRVT